MTFQRIPGRVAAILAALLLGACAASSGGRAPASSEVITRAEIEGTGATTAYEVIERLQPRWLRARTNRSFNRGTDVVVFVDNLQFESVDSLWEIDAANVVRIRWLDSAQAGQLPGLGSRHVEGAIVVETR